jgi:chromosomal replication initiator protein
MVMDNTWHSVKSKIKGLVPSHSYRMWIEPITCEMIAEDEITLCCTNSFSRKRVQDLYGKLISCELNRETGKEYTIEFSINSHGKRSNGNGFGKEQQLYLPNMNVRSHSGRYLRKEFTFDHFVVGGNNDFAYTASLAYASRKETQQNALYLMSNTGMGKSHLSQAIGHYILSASPTERVYYITAEDFTNEMIQAIRNGSIDKFKEKYRTQCDVLLLEDIHFLSGKERTQTELALTLDNLYDSSKKLIFTSCYSPNSIPRLNDTLRSRFAGGLISTIDPPDFKTRVKIIRKKAQLKGFTIPDDVVQYMAGELIENVRQLESGLVGVTAKSSLLGTPIDRDLAESVVKNIASQRKKITIDSIKKLVCHHFKISVAEIVSSSRKKNIVRPRQIAMYLSRKFTDQPLQAIGKHFNRYHATALHSIRSIEKGLKDDTLIKQQVKIISDKINAGKL